MSIPPATPASSPGSGAQRRVGKLLVWSLAGIGTLWVAFHGVAWVARITKGYWSTEKAAASFPSPDGRFKAVVFVSMGGGPGTSYCGTSVYVVPATFADAWIGGLSNLVYSAHCGGMSEGHWEQNIIWRSPRLLEIAFDPTAGAADGGLEIREDAIRGEVQIKFGFHPAGDSW
jgi:hypothetical protein